MAQDIEEFLRMAAARKKQQQAGQGTPASSGSPQAPAESRQSSPPNQQSGRGAAPQRQQPPVQPEIYIGDEVESQHQSHPNLQSSIAPTVSTADIVEHASHLGEQLQNRGQLNQTRVQHKFDHDLGSLQKNEIRAPAVVDQGRGLEDMPDLSAVIKQLMNPRSVRQAFILKEIFERPKF